MKSQPCHSRERGNRAKIAKSFWIPAFAGMTLLLAAVSPSASAQNQEQVNVSVKVVEFQSGDGVETGFSAYFKQRLEPQPYGQAAVGAGTITAADVTFPSSASQGITVFLDRLTSHYGDFEVVLQGLVDENRAYILSRPKVLVPVGSALETVITTSQQIPYEDTIVVGATTTQITKFRDTGVTLKVKALRLVDDDGNVNTTEDTYIQLLISAVVNEEGQRITVALADLGGSGLNRTSAISAPEFVSRSIDTTVWVRHGQVLVMGGLYRNTKNKDLATLPWLTQTEDFVTGAIQRVAPFAPTINPVSVGVGNNSRSESRRELVFLLKADRWRPAFTVADEFGFTEEEAEETDSDNKKKKPGDVVEGVMKGLGDIPKDVADGISGGATKEDEIRKSLGNETP